MAHVNKGDKVQVIAGNHKGKTGTITSVNEAKQRVVVEGVRKIKKTLKPTESNPEGGITEIDGPIHISNVKKVD